MKKCIALSGTSGIGKTSLAKALAEHYELDLITEDLGSIIQKSNALNSNLNPNRRPDLLGEYLDACESWINQRSQIIAQSNVVLDRFALDVLNRIIISNQFKDNNAVIKKFALMLYRQAQSIDILIIPHIHLPGVPEVNEAGMRRKQSFSQRLLSQSTSIGLAKIYCKCPLILLPPYLTNFDSKLEKLIDQIDLLYSKKSQL